jgi:hypothetical protein
MNLREMEWGGWIDMARDKDSRLALKTAIMELRAPYSAENFLTV